MDLIGSIEAIEFAINSDVIYEQLPNIGGLIGSI